VNSTDTTTDIADVGSETLATETKLVFADGRVIRGKP